MAFKMKYGKGMPFNYGSSLKKPHDYENDSDTRKITRKGIDGNRQIINHQISKDEDASYLGTDLLGKPITKNSTVSSTVVKKKKKTDRKFKILNSKKEIKDINKNARETTHLNKYYDTEGGATSLSLPVQWARKKIDGIKKYFNK